MNTATVTTGQNGYPQGMYNVVVADTMTELNDLQAQHGGELVMLKQRAGWSMWNNIGSHYGNMLGMNASDSDTVLRYRAGSDIEQMAFELVVGGYDSAAAAMADIYPDAIIDEMMATLKTWKERIEEITEAVTEGEYCDIWMGNPDPTYINFTVDAESVSYTTDVWTYRIALKTDNIE